MREASVTAARTERCADDVPARVNTFDAEDMEGGFLRDILRGPSSSLYGSDALGGVVRTGIGPNITAPQDPLAASIDRYTSPGRNVALSMNSSSSKEQP